MGNKGQVYEKGWDGEYRPKEGLFGPKEAEVKTGLLSGEPEPVRDWAGNQVHASDGSPLFKAGGASFEDAAAEGIAGFVIMVVLALVALGAWLFAKVVRWWWPRALAATRRDIAVGRVSLDSVGLWLPATGFVALIIGSITNSGTSPLGWVLGLLFLAGFLEVVSYAGLHLVDAVNALRGGHGAVRPVLGWGAAAGLLAWMAVASFGSRTSGALGAILGLGILVALVVGGVWGAQGRPDWLSQAKAAAASSAASSEPVTWGESSSVASPASSGAPSSGPVLWGAASSAAAPGSSLPGPASGDLADEDQRDLAFLPDEGWPGEADATVALAPSADEALKLAEPAPAAMLVAVPEATVEAPPAAEGEPQDGRKPAAQGEPDDPRDPPSLVADPILEPPPPPAWDSPATPGQAPAQDDGDSSVIAFLDD